MTAEPARELTLEYKCGCSVTLFNEWPAEAEASLCPHHQAPVRISRELRWRVADDIELARIKERDAYV